MKKSCFLIACCSLLLVIAPLTFSQEWGDPPGGWDGWYSDWADLADWNHDNGSDQWDETPPGVGAPGGAKVETVDGEQVLSIEDAGDPRGAGFPDPGSNRKIYFQQEATSGGNIFEDGVTFIARWRINPNPLEAPADGNDLHDGGKGHVGIAHDGAVAGDGTDYNMSFALDTGGLLYFANQVDPLQVGDEFQFHAVWATAVLSGDLVSINVYVDGATDPAFSGDVALGDGADGNFANYVAVGMGSTGRDGAIQVDFIGFKVGLHPPSVGAAVAPADKLPSMWGEMKMGL